jgi:UDP-N-acetylmuramoyl-tripeptide--D-alanyl-D-alanine ligase
VLEFGSCHVGDVEYLMELGSPDVGVLTAIEVTHLQFYGSPEAIELEEGKIVTMLPPSGAVIVNVDNPGAAAAVGRASCRIVTYGFDAAAQVRGLAAVSWIDWDRLTGRTHLDIQCGERRGTLTIDGTLGSHSCYAPLAALGVSQAVGIPFAQAIRALRNYVPPAGRMRCRAGLNHSLVIDDSYNSSPAATMKALDVLAEVSASRESTEAIAVLGPMAELGPVSRSQHEAVGRHAAGLGLDCLVTLGDQAGDTARAARDAEMPADRVHEVAVIEEAIRVVTARLKRGAVVLVKGSRSCGMERVADALSEDTERVA